MMLRFISTFILIFLSFAVYPSDELIADLDRQTKDIYALLQTDLENALKKAEALEHQAAQIDNFYHEANSLYIQGWIRLQTGHSGEAFAAYMEALNLLKTKNLVSYEEKDLQARLLIEVSIVLNNHKEFTISLNYLNKCIEYAKENNLSARLWYSYLFFSEYCSKETNRNQDALMYINKALETAKLSNKRYLIYKAINQKGLIYTNAGLYNQARESFQAILEEYDNQDLQFKARHNIANTYLQEENYEMALAQYEEAETYISDQTSNHNKFLVWLDLADVHYKLGNLPEAKHFGLLAEEKYQSVQLKPEHYRLYEILSSIHFEIGDYKQSHIYSKKHFSENDRFLKTQDDLIRIRNSYKMEIIASSFLIDTSNTSISSLYSWLISILGLFVTIILILSMIHQYHMKRSVKKDILKICASNL